MIVCDFVGDRQGMMELDGKTIHVEFHSYCGPVIMDETYSNDITPMPDENSIFWKMAKVWEDGGFRRDSHGFCLTKTGTHISDKFIT